MIYIHKTPTWLQSLFPRFVWHMPRNDNNVYLTFDDGPVPEATPWVLNTLDKFNAKATFFCVGDNVVKHSQLFDELMAAGHTVANHTHNHLRGSRYSLKEYMDNIALADRVMTEHGMPLRERKLFRPPYGRIKREQVLALAPHYDIIMWDVLSYDFEKMVSAEYCKKGVIKNTSPGSIVLFHDSVKTIDKLKHVLPDVLQYMQDQGWNMKVL